MSIGDPHNPSQFAQVVKPCVPTWVDTCSELVRGLSLNRKVLILHWQRTQ
ncbi:MAG: hypothetical protein PUP93_16680 [Rhizonema sp. NSF051]|nr:hypothetical protein [Rhizonema sp. NSF051]